MRLWLSGEIDRDVADYYRMSLISIEKKVNQRLENISLDAPYMKWAFLAIIRDEESPQYEEISRRNVKRKVLEFRLKIDHGKFLNCRDPSERELMVIKALKRSVDLMAKFNVTESDRNSLQKVLEGVTDEIKNQSRGQST